MDALFLRLKVGMNRACLPSLTQDEDKRDTGIRKGFFTFL